LFIPEPFEFFAVPVGEAVEDAVLGFVVRPRIAGFVGELRDDFVQRIITGGQALADFLGEVLAVDLFKQILQLDRHFAFRIAQPPGVVE
jgi:hypothetical protein